MPQLTTYQLTFSHGWRRGRQSLELAESGVELPSDTLFAALTHAWRYSGGDVAAWTEAFTTRPPALFTSAFPYAGSVRFFPMPARLDPLFSRETLRRRGKHLKRVQYLSEGLMRRLLAGRQLNDALFPDDEYAEPTSGLALQGGALWLTDAEVAALPAAWRQLTDRRYALRRQSVWAEEKRPRVTVGRRNSQSTLFHVGRIFFAPDCGLWLGIHWLDAERRLGKLSARDAVHQALSWLQDAGLGGERSVGYGAFQFQSGRDLVLPDPDPAGLGYLLSRYHPTAAELRQGVLDGSGVAYRLLTVGGFLYSPDSPARLRQQVRFLAEGSLVRQPPADAPVPLGDLLDIGPRAPHQLPHPVLRYGYALSAGLTEPPHV